MTSHCHPFVQQSPCTKARLWVVIGWVVGYVNFIWPRVVGLAGPRLGARSQPRVNSGQLMGGGSCQWCRRRRRELVMTLTELRAMAAAAIIGDNSQPRAG